MEGLRRFLLAFAACLLLGLWSASFAGTIGLASGQFVGGGGQSSSPRFAVTGTAGQPISTTDASFGGRFAVRGGVWTQVTPWLNTPPTLAGATNAAIDELAGYVQPLVPQDADIPAQALTVSLVSGPSGLVVTNGVLAWTPTEAQGPSTNTVLVSVTDGVATVTNALTVVVREVNAAPVPFPDMVERRAGEVAKVAAAVLLANDTDAEGDVLVVTSVTSRSAMGGTVVLDGVWVVYTPPVPDVISGDDSFGYEVSDGKGGIARGTVTVRVTGPPQPTAGPLSITDLGSEAGRVQLRFDAMPGRTYRLEAAQFLEGPWGTLASVVADANGKVVVEQPTGGMARFFRVTEP